MLFYIGALIPTYLISRLFIFVFNKIFKEEKYVWANLLSAFVCGSIIALSDMYGFNNYFIAMFAGIIDYMIPQSVWLIRDILLHNPNWRKEKFYKSIKNVLFVSYLKNKGVRRICFLVGFLTALFAFLLINWEMSSIWTLRDFIIAFYWPFLLAIVIRWVVVGFKEKDKTSVAK